MLKLSIILIFISLAVNVNSQCWKTSYGRGVGVPISSCPDGFQRDGALCYPTCRAGFYGVGPVCWSHCNSGYQDRGAICWRDTHIYGKGCCCFFGRCCNNCNSGYRDDGCTCRRDVHSYVKQSYGRGAGRPLSCRSDQEYDAGLCYTRCRSGFSGVGPVCWGQCQGTDGTNCGAFCASSGSACSAKTAAFLQGGVDIATSALALYAAPTPQTMMSFASSNIGLTVELLMDTCPSTASSCWKRVVTKSGSCQNGFTDGGALCWSPCSGANSYNCGAFCANSAINCARLTLSFIQSGIDTANSIQKIRTDWTPDLPKFDKAELLGDFIKKAGGLGAKFVFPVCS